MHKPSDSAAVTSVRITLVDLEDILASDTLTDIPRVDFDESDLAWFRGPIGMVSL